jgi:uncharacterized membrane protein (UPF0127 family)
LSHLSTAHRGLLALAAGMILGAPAHADNLPRQNPAHCVGQREIRPLQHLALITARGRFDFTVEFADTDAKREYGLMCRRSLAPNRGMLFDFKTPQETAFWMRNTLIPLDIVYIAPDGRVVSIARNAAPLDETPLGSGGVVRGVLEIPGGRAAQIGLMPGDKVIHRIFPA